MEHLPVHPASGQERAEIALLLDFYGGCLTEKQRQAAEMYFQEDLSLGEIALLTGITRQGVRDCLKKAENALFEMEEKTGLAQRHRRQRGQLEELQALAHKAAQTSPELGGEMLEIIQRLLSE